MHGMLLAHRRTRSTVLAVRQRWPSRCWLSRILATIGVRPVISGDHSLTSSAFGTVVKANVSSSNGNQPRYIQLSLKLNF